MTDAVFSNIDHPSFPKWMGEGVDAVFRAQPSVGRVVFTMWATAHHRSPSTLHGDVGFVPIDGPRPKEEDLDLIPQVRMMERRACELWNLLPIGYEDEEGMAALNGDCDIHADREGVLSFTYDSQTDEEVRMIVKATYRDGAWRYVDQITTGHYPGPRSDILAGDVDQIASIYDPSDLGLEMAPEVLSVSIGDDDAVVLLLKPGELTRCMIKR